MKRFRDTKGFTLVELIVVIAIIAILAAVSIVSYSKYIDNGRFSNDTQMAKSMTTILTNHLILNPEEELDAFDVRTIINEYSDEELDFETESKDSAFFYIENQNKIIVEKFDDITGNPDFLSKQERTTLLSDQELDAPLFSSPEELFGEGTFMLSTSGSPEAIVVNFIANLLPLSSNVVYDFDDIETKVVSGNTWYMSLLGFGVSQERISLIENLLSDFDPETTLYVNNTSWATGASDGDEVKRVLFARGISNIPTYDLGITVSVEDDKVELPKTVRTIEKEAFSGIGTVGNPITVSWLSTITLRTENDAFSDNVAASEGLSTISLNTTDLINYSAWITFSRDEGIVTYSVQNLPIRSNVTGYHIIPQGDFVMIKIYTDEGLVGFANNLFSLTYYDADGNIYFTSNTTDYTFDLPSIGNPEGSGNWEYNGSTIDVEYNMNQIQSRTLAFNWVPE
jgi:prepilin-type N-terminal cleavage/methylation domain-containing protein